MISFLFLIFSNREIKLSKGEFFKFTVYNLNLIYSVKQYEKTRMFLVSQRVDVRPQHETAAVRCARPTSLYPLRPNDSGIIGGHDALQPEKEPIIFDVSLVGAPPEVEQLVNNIKQVAEQFLYHWKTFPISMCSTLNSNR